MTDVRLENGLSELAVARQELQAGIWQARNRLTQLQAGIAELQSLTMEARAVAGAASGASGVQYDDFTATAPP